jgi:hypothetical protein
MRQNVQHIRVDDMESFPELTIVGSSEMDKKHSGEDRPELLVLGWEPRQQRLARLRSNPSKG